MNASSKIQSVFDLALKRYKGGNTSEGYSFDDGRVYYAYSTREDWISYLETMKQCHKKAYEEFKECNGGEFLEKESSSGKLIPPKMASYASSSRFIFEESSLLGDYFVFECKLPIAFKGYGEEATASLDGYIPSKRIFVEAKCHEFYSETTTEFKKSYSDFYKYLHDKTDGLFEYYTIKTEKTENVHFKWKGRILKSLDLKQLLCHMLGIAKKALLEDCSEISTLIYLVYKPTDDLLYYVQDDVDKKRIIDIWKNEQEEAECIDYNLLYRFITNYIYTRKKSWQKDGQYSSRVKEISEAFTFKFCDQNKYKEFLSEIVSPK